MGRWKLLDSLAKTPLHALLARKGCRWQRGRTERSRRRRGGFPCDAGQGNTDTRRKGGAK